MKVLLVLGAGDYGQVVANLARQMRAYDSIFFLDDSSSYEFVIDSCDNFKKYIREDVHMYPAFIDNRLQLDWYNRLIACGVTVPNIIRALGHDNSVCLLPQSAVN